MCAGKLCGQPDDCGGTCAAGSGCCTPTCAGQLCGAVDGCNGTCQPGGGCCGGLASGYALPVNQAVYSCNGNVVLAHQGDGNVVLYQGGTLALWSTVTAGYTTSVFWMQGDGNLVLYGPASEVYWALSWYLGYNSAGAWAAVQDDCNFVVYTADSRPIWATGTGCH